jgi:diadenosine tetraphosphate (Ap4A) HIT family hydrolase
MTSSCLICDRVRAIREGDNPSFVAELPTGLRCPWRLSILERLHAVLYKQHVAELHDLEPDLRLSFLNEMSIVAEAVYRAFLPDKLNYELLGNSEPHLHWHLFPRRKDEPDAKQPVWVVDKAIRYSESVRPSALEIAELKVRLRRELAALGAEIKD